MKDLMGLMKQAQQMQERMAGVQAELELIEVEGQAGGGAVKIVMTAKGQIKSVAIDASLMVPDEKEIVEDLVVAAANDARGKAERTMQERMAEITKGLPLPPGMKLF
jgi:DNA-binding YbaB/EbfC family protein